MENITINQKQLFDVIKRTMSLSKEYAIEKLDADGNFIVFVNGDFTDFFILRKSIVDYITTKSTVYADLQDAYNKLAESAKAHVKELFNREDEIKSLKEELKVLRDDKSVSLMKLLKLTMMSFIRLMLIFKLLIINLLITIRILVTIIMIFNIYQILIRMI